jgi:hypothetical protein
MLEHHAREHQVEAARDGIRLGEIAGDVEAGLLQPLRRAIEFELVDVVDGQRQAPEAPGLVGRKPGSRPPPISHSATETEAAAPVSAR